MMQHGFALPGCSLDLMLTVRPSCHWRVAQTRLSRTLLSNIPNSLLLPTVELVEHQLFGIQWHSAQQAPNIDKRNI